MNTLIFDIETIPDVVFGRNLLNLPEAADNEVAEKLFERRKQTTGGSDFLPLHQHKIVAISVVIRTATYLKVWSLGELDSAESDLIERFYLGIKKYKPQLVSWNGSGFDLPLLHYRSLKYGIPATSYWEMGEKDPNFKWNNYLNRYHMRHLDLMDVLAGYQARANAPLDEIALLLGLPGKMGQSGANVWEQHQSNQLTKIRDYCETDVLNTYLIYLHFQKIRGQLTQEAYLKECELLQETLQKMEKPHLDAFLAHWRGTS